MDNKQFLMLLCSFHEHLNATITKLSSKRDFQGSKFHELQLASGIFAQYQFPIKDTYTKSAKQYYGSLVDDVDFTAHPEDATEIINRYECSFCPTAVVMAHNT